MDLEKRIVTAHGTFLIRPYRDEDEQNVLDLWELAFGHKMQPEILRWKFHTNPFGRHIMLCLSEDNTAVAMYSGIPYAANLEDEEVSFTQLMDNMSHPGYRQAVAGRRGLFVETADHFFDVYGGRQASVFHYGFAGNRHFRLGMHLLGYRLAVPVKYLTSRSSGLKNRWFGKKGLVKEILAFGPEFDELWERAALFYPLAAKRTSRFLNWRFSEHPVNRYRVFSSYLRTGGIRAYVVISVNDRVASVVDLLCIAEDNGLPEIFSHLKKEFLRTGVTTVRTWLPENHFTVKKMRRLGFVSQPEPFGIIPGDKAFDDKLTTLYTTTNLYYTMADCDLL